MGMHILHQVTWTGVVYGKVFCKSSFLLYGLCFIWIGVLCMHIFYRVVFLI